MPFERGISGNKAGRPRGRPDKRTKHRALFEAAAPEIIAKAIEKAKAGDVDCIRLCLDRIAPRLRDEAPRRRLSLDSALPIEAQAAQVIDALRVGEVSADEAGALLQGLGRVAEIQRIGAIADVVALLASRQGVPLPPELRIRRAAPAMLTEEPNA
jgi:hypothetical protein